MHFQTEILAPSNLGALLPPTGVRCKLRHLQVAVTLSLPLVCTTEEISFLTVFLPYSISLFPLETLKVPPLASKLHPFESSIPMKIKFFRRLGTCLTSVNVKDLLSAMRNWTDPFSTTLLAVLFASHIHPSHAAYIENTSLSLSLHKW